ncbi:MAG: hypothetical protein QOH88_2364 [Verrucomicrobiota bacterium]|jgi:hypothetical protein
MTPTRTARLQEILKAALFALGATITWLLLLDFSKAPLVPQLEPSWIAAITFGAAEKLQFGREIIYTYGPLGHLVFSTYSPVLFTADFIMEICLKGTYVTLIWVLSLRLRPIARGCFLLGAFVVAVLSYQAMYVFVIAALGWVLIERSRSNNLLLVPLLLFGGIAALIKITFLSFAVVVLTGGLTACLVQRRFVRAAVGMLGFTGAFCLAWIFSGQQLAHLPEFLWAASEITRGYPKTMSLPAPGSILAAGFAVGLLICGQLTFSFLRSKRQFPSVALTLLLGAAVFLSWKLGFSRADGHTAEFFYLAILLAISIPLFYHEELTPFGVINGAIAAGVVAISASTLYNQDPGLSSHFTGIVRARGQSNFSTLLHPAADAARWQAANAQYQKEFALPRIKQTVGDAPVDVFGYEQAIAIVNGLNYRPSPTVQTYCDYSPALSLANAAFYRSSRAPEYVIFKNQPIDNRLPTIDSAEVFVRLLQNYEPLFAERGYLLLRRQKFSETSLASEVRLLEKGTAKIGESIPVPQGMIWCELEINESFVGKLTGFLYHSPEMYLQMTSADGEVTQRRIFPTLAGIGFLVNPMPTSESDFVEAAAGRPSANSTIRTIRVVQNAAIGRLYRSRLTFRFSEISMPPLSKPYADALARELQGYTDVFSTPAVAVKSGFPLERFVLDGKRFLLVHPEGEVRFNIPPGATAAAGDFAIRPEAYLGGKTDGVEFLAEFAPSDQAQPSTVLYHRLLQPVTVEADRGIQRFRVELPAGASGQFVLRTLPGPAGRYDWDWAGWSDLSFEPFAVSPRVAHDISDLADQYGDIFNLRPLRIFSPAPLQRFKAGSGTFLLVHPLGEVVFKIPPNTKQVSGKFTIDPRVRDAGHTDGVEFRIAHAPDGGAPEQTLFTRTLKPAEQAGDAEVQEFSVTLPAGAGGTLILRTLPGPAQNSDWDWAGWSGIRFQ